MSTTDDIPPTLYRCAGANCPGLPYRASEIGHPASCVEPPPDADDAPEERGARADDVAAVAALAGIDPPRLSVDATLQGLKQRVDIAIGGRRSNGEPECSEQWCRNLLAAFESHAFAISQAQAAERAAHPATVVTREEPIGEGGTHSRTVLVTADASIEARAAAAAETFAANERAPGVLAAWQAVVRASDASLRPLADAAMARAGIRTASDAMREVDDDARGIGRPITLDRARTLLAVLSTALALEVVERSSAQHERDRLAKVST